MPAPPLLGLPEIPAPPLAVLELPVCGELVAVLEVLVGVSVDAVVVVGVLELVEVLVVGVVELEVLDDVDEAVEVHCVVASWRTSSAPCRRFWTRPALTPLPLRSETALLICVAAVPA